MWFFDAKHNFYLMLPCSWARGFLLKSMDNARFFDDENIPLAHDGDYYEDYNTPNTSRVDETSFRPITTEKKSTNINFTAKTKSKTR